MKTILLSILSLTLVSCTGFDTDPVKGELSTSYGYLEISKGTQRATLEEGETTIQFSHGIYGITNPSLIVKQGGEEIAEIEIPKTAFEGEKVKISGREIKQKFDLTAQKGKKLLKTWNKDLDSVSCTYSGYCYDCETTFDSDGKSNYSCGYAHRSSCSGSRWEKRKYETYAVTVEIDLFRLNSSERIAKFSGKTDKQYTEYRVLDRGSCN